MRSRRRAARLYQQRHGALPRRRADCRRRRPGLDRAPVPGPVHGPDALLADAGGHRERREPALRGPRACAARRAGADSRIRCDRGLRPDHRRRSSGPLDPPGPGRLPDGSLCDPAAGGSQARLRRGAAGGAIPRRGQSAAAARHLRHPASRADRRRGRALPSHDGGRHDPRVRRCARPRRGRQLSRLRRRALPGDPGAGAARHGALRGLLPTIGPRRWHSGTRSTGGCGRIPATGSGPRGFSPANPAPRS